MIPEERGLLHRLDDSEQIRAFFAIVPPDEIKKAVAAAAGKLYNARTFVSFTREENLHFTLKFLGEARVSTLKEAAILARGIASQSRCFRMRVTGWGCFPGFRKPRVVWAGASEGAEESGRLASELEAALVGLGFPAENRYKAHITVGRVREHRMPPVEGPARLKALLEEAPPEMGGFEVDTIFLMRSILAPGGSRYDILARFPLTGGANTGGEG